MPDALIPRGERKSVGIVLTLVIHLEAFKANPRAYVVALWWKLRRKRVRSRSQFARLLGSSKRAYDLWILWKEALPPVPVIEGSAPFLVALVESGGEPAELQATLASLKAEGIGAVIFERSNPRSFAEAIENISWEENPWLLPMRAGDEVARGCAAMYRQTISHSDTKIIYADDDILDRKNTRTQPHFKPAWNSELFKHLDYITGASILRIAESDAGNVAPSDCWMRDLVQIALSDSVPVHIPSVLHHRRSRPLPLRVRALVASKQTPLVSVIVPTRNRVDLLRTCLSCIKKTNYPNVELIVVDNDSDDTATLEFLESIKGKACRVLRYGGRFNFSAINNYAVSAARGAMICLLNNDVEVVEPNWLGTMVRQALRPDVGAVGACLLYPNGRIQHAGVVLGVGNAAGHAHRFLSPAEEGYFGRHMLPQFTSAVTAACLVVAKDRYLAVNGFDETKFPVAFNDVDLCLRLNERGWQSLYEPRAVLIHHESVSRGTDQDPVGAARLARELASLQERWQTHLITDPFHHPQLSRASEQFCVRL